jgi:predicted transcriptional regulator
MVYSNNNSNNREMARMKTLIVRIGGDIKKELKEVYLDPKNKAQPNTHTLYLKDGKELYKILSPERIELLKYITNNACDNITIGELAKELNRRQEAVSRDTILLEKYNLIQKIKDKQKVYIRAIYSALDIKLGNVSTC